MSCKDCPYGEDDFERRMYNYNKIIEEHGIPNDIYHNLKPEDAVDEFEQFVWCDKVGGEVQCFGHCSDFYELEEIARKNHSNKKRRNKRERYIKHKTHLKRLAEEPSGYPTPAYLVDKVWVKKYGYVKILKPYYKRIYRGQRSKYLKRISNKKIRRYRGDISNGFMCHKLYDFWWEMY